MSPAFGISTPQLLQIFYGHAKGLLASKTIAAIYHDDTLEAYHQNVLASFIPPHVMLPLLNSLYYRPQHSEEHLSDYIADIKEVEAFLHQDIDEVAVVDTILDVLHPRRRNRLVFCDKPCDWTACVYTHNIAYPEDIMDPSLQRIPSSPSQPFPSPMPMRSSTVVCYSCNNPGHTRRTCHT
jgi:hypothetical protein